MQANRLKPRFKNPFDLTVDQAMGIGGGRTRQSVNQKQHTLNDVRIDRKALIYIKPGNKLHNTAAKYKINYKMILAASPAYSESPDRPSREIDNPLTIPLRSIEDSVDDNTPILRSDQKRSDKISSSGSNVITGSKDVTAPGRTEKKVIEFRENGVGYVIAKAREIWGEWVPRVNTLSMDEVEQIARFQKEAVDEAFKANALAMKDTTAKHRPGRGSTRWILNRLQDPEKFGAPKILTAEQKQRKKEYEKAGQLEQDERERLVKAREPIENAKASLSSEERVELKTLAEAEVKKMDGIKNVGFMLETLISVKENELLRMRLDQKGG